MSKKLKIGFTSYINSYPYLFPFRTGKIHTPFTAVVAPPRQLNALLANDELDLALISPVEYQKGGYHFLSSLGIGAIDEILSVNFYLKNREANRYRVDLTQESTTSIALLQILARTFWKKELVSAEDGENRLLIGDRALKNRYIPGYQTLDLAKEWFGATGKGFVFALLATKEMTLEKYGPELAAINSALHEALLWSEMHRGEIIDALPDYSPTLLERYFTACRYQLGEKELQGLQYFLNYVLVSARAGARLRTIFGQGHGHSRARNWGSFKNLMYNNNSPPSIQELFSTIAPCYDRANKVLSLGMHKLWNKKLVHSVRGAKKLLDLCAGTGEIGLDFLKMTENTHATLLDFCPEMLEVAKIKGKAIEKRFVTVTGDAQKLPFAAMSFDAITIAYGVRNLENRLHCFQESHRVLQQGGVLAILELTRPRNGCVRFLHKSYLRYGLPLLGRWVAKNGSAYTYLAQSITHFSPPEELGREIEALGFARQKPYFFFGGVATLLIFKKI